MAAGRRGQAGPRVYCLYPIIFQGNIGLYAASDQATPLVDARALKRPIMLNHPPNPRLTLRVGIAGHRPKPYRSLSTAVARVERQLRDVAGEE